MESRKKNPSKTSPLPVDYLRLVREVFTTNFEEGLRALRKIHPVAAHFEATGRIYADEIVAAVSLVHENQLAATTVMASVDFDPKASSPTLQDLLAACIDAIGSVFGGVLSPDNEAGLQSLAEESLSALENVPFEWTQVEANKIRIWVKIDKSNPTLDQAADDWLAKHDPDAREREEEEQRETESLFVTGPGGKRDTSRDH